MYVCVNRAVYLTEEREWRRQSQAVQRGLPRPADVNTSVLRGAPHKDQKYRDLYKVCICVDSGNRCILSVTVFARKQYK